MIFKCERCRREVDYGGIIWRKPYLCPACQLARDMELERKGYAFHWSKEKK